MDQINRGLTVLFILLFAFAVAFFIFYRLGLFTRFFPNSKLSLSGLFSNSTPTTKPTPTLTPTITPEATPSPRAGTTVVPTAYITQTRQPIPTRTIPTLATPPINIPRTGSPTLVLPLLASLGGLGIYMSKKSK